MLLSWLSIYSLPWCLLPLLDLRKVCPVNCLLENASAGWREAKSTRGVLGKKVRGACCPADQGQKLPLSIIPLSYEQKGESLSQQGFSFSEHVWGAGNLHTYPVPEEFQVFLLLRLLECLPMLMRHLRSSLFIQ